MIELQHEAWNVGLNIVKLNIRYYFVTLKAEKYYGK